MVTVLSISAYKPRFVKNQYLPKSIYASENSFTIYLSGNSTHVKSFCNLYFL